MKLSRLYSVCVQPKAETYPFSLVVNDNTAMGGKLILELTLRKGEDKINCSLKVHKIEIFFGFDFEICIISLLVMSKY
jgi:hypothetical protein